MKLTIIGASGHGKVIADIAALNGYDEIVFLDDNKSILECAGYPVVGNSMADFDGEVFVAIGNAFVRQRLMERYADRKQPVLIHPSAVIAKSVTIGKGSAVMAGAVINPGVKVGQGVIVNTCSSIDHDCIIGNFVHAAVGVHISGTVVINDCTWIGTGSTISNNINICGECVIGAGAVVIKNIVTPGTYVGVPARRIRE